MDYQKHYNALISKAQHRSKPDQYCERHHIVPRCLGGDNSKDNIVWLTYKEHFLAHLLLHKMNPEHIGLNIAISRMIGSEKNQGRSYEWIKKGLSDFYAKFHSKNAIERWKNKEYKDRMSIVSKNVWDRDGYREGMRNKNLGANNPMYGKRMSRESKIKMTSKLKSFNVWKSIKIKSSSKLGSGIYKKGEYVGEFSIRSEFEQIYGIHRQLITKCLNNKAPQAGGFIFEYASKS